jgi:membrane-bound ClpP family serine protease
MPSRSAAELRSSIESNRAELAVSLDRLHSEVARVTDWRSQLERHRREVIVGAAVAGTLLLLGMRRRKRR